MKRKMIGLLMGTAMAVTMLAGCGGGSSAENTEVPEGEAVPTADAGGSTEDKTLRVASIHSLNLPYHNWLKTEYEAKAEEYGFEFTAFNNEQDDSQTVSIIQDCIEQGYDVILFPLTQGDQSDLIQQARDAGIAMVSFNLSTDWANGVVTQIVCDEHGLGYASGQQAAKELPENAKIVILEGLAGIDASTGRRAGYEDGLLAERPDIEVLADSYADFDKAKQWRLWMTGFRHMIRLTESWQRTTVWRWALMSLWSPTEKILPRLRFTELTVWPKAARQSSTENCQVRCCSPQLHLQILYLTICLFPIRMESWIW